MRKIYILLLAVVSFFLLSCESENERITKSLTDYLSSRLPDNAGVQVLSFEPLKETKPGKEYQSDVKFTFTEADGGIQGHGDVTAVFDGQKKSVRHLILYPGHITLDERSPYHYTIYSSETANAYQFEKRMVNVVIYEQLSEDALTYLSKRIVYEHGLFISHLNISYYVNGMSLNGPNYAFCDVTTTAHSFSCKPQINVLTANKPAAESSQTNSAAAEKAPYDGADIVGMWQFIGPSSLIIYQKNNTYYMVTEDNGKFSAPDKLIKLTYRGYPSYKYVEDTGEIFSVRPDGLYGYADGDLSSVFHNL